MTNLDFLNQLFLWFAIFNYGQPGKSPPLPPPVMSPAVVCEEKAPITYDSVVKDLDVSTWKHVYTEVPACERTQHPRD